ncbi:MAG: ribonuclease HII [Firmicutes bacterium]|nr:ribonuclease HII [Bacillota bacterium]
MNRTTDEYEEIYYQRNQLVMGIDEAGRGPICGPLVVAGCIMPIGYENSEIYDSKKISEKKREKLFKQIISDAVYYKLEIVSPKEIDRLNIYEATKQAMTRIAESYNDCVVLTDAMKLDINKEVIDIVKGDMKSINIAAASILAKVLRDYIMLGYDHLYPEYELAKHKGYPTKRHLELIEIYGIKDFYRMSYSPCQKVNMLRLF